MEDIKRSFDEGLPEVFKNKYNGGRTAASASQASQATPAVRHYASDELKKIGDACSKRLPPASAVLAMFQYELQRQSEVESLFQGSMFRLAQAEDTSSNHETRIRQLEQQLDLVQKQLQIKDVQERLATSKLRMNQQKAMLDECAAKVQAHDKLLADFLLKLDNIAKASTAGEQPNVKPGELLEEVTLIKEDVDSLFDEKEAMCQMIADGGQRITKLEDMVRSLTLQISTSMSSTTSSPAMAQRLPVQSANGHSVDLLVPRGSGLSTGKENRAVSIVDPISRRRMG